ncbi:MAG TPA: polyhydroxyalkanoate depolymerase [Paraburkholderia sp.]|nr:polyhydroxyalkanoate depolymerase [Paraburkholderia sp.]
MYAWIDAQRRLNAMLFAQSPQGSAERAGTPRRPPFMLPGYDWLSRLLMPPDDPPTFDIASVQIGDSTVPVSETIVEADPFCTLRHFAREIHTDLAPVLLCAPLAGHHAVILRQTVETLLGSRDVYVTDWVDARDVPLSAGGFGLDDDVRLLARFLARLGGPDLHVVAICQAAAPALAALALRAADGEPAPRSLTIVGGPIDTHPNPTLVDDFARSCSIEWLRDALTDTVPAPYAGAGRRVLPGYLQHLCLLAANPWSQLAAEARCWSHYVADDDANPAGKLQTLADRAAVLDMDAAYFLETVQTIFRENRLAMRTWRVDGRLVPVDAITRTALFTIEAGFDRITGAQQTHAAHRLCTGVPPSMRQWLTVPGCDHYGLFNGPHWQREVFPALAAFWDRLEARDGRDAPAPPRSKQATRATRETGGIAGTGALRRRASGTGRRDAPRPGSG